MGKCLQSKAYSQVNLTTSQENGSSRQEGKLARDRPGPVGVRVGPCGQWIRKSGNQENPVGSCAGIEVRQESLLHEARMLRATSLAKGPIKKKKSHRQLTRSITFLGLDLGLRIKNFFFSEYSWPLSCQPFGVWDRHSTNEKIYVENCKIKLYRVCYILIA